MQVVVSLQTSSTFEVSNFFNKPTSDTLEHIIRTILQDTKRFLKNRILRNFNRNKRFV